MSQLEFKVPIIAVFIEILSANDIAIEHRASFFIIPPEDAKRLMQTVSEEYKKEHPKYDDRWIPNEDLEQFRDRWDLLWEEI